MKSDVSPQAHRRWYRPHHTTAHDGSALIGLMRKGNKISQLYNVNSGFIFLSVLLSTDLAYCTNTHYQLLTLVHMRQQQSLCTEKLTYMKSRKLGPTTLFVLN